MNTTTGKVIDIDTGPSGCMAWVAVDSSVVCSRCAAGRGCGAGLTGSRSGPRRVAAEVGAGVQLQTGDTVRLMVDSGKLLQAAWLVYGWPLLGAATGAAGSMLLDKNDAVAAMAALAGLLFGCFAVRRQLTRQGCMDRFAFKILARIGTHSVGPDRP